MPQSKIIPYGFCHCGCGQKTNLARQTDPSHGWIKGEPLRYKRFHRKNQLVPSTEAAAPFKIDGVYCRLIPLTKKQWAIVWESDYKWLSQRSWCACWDRTAQTFYAKCGDTSMHRLILGLERGNPRIGDHCNRIGIDNRRSNLRVTDRAGNAHNRKRATNNTSGYKGVRQSPRHNGVYEAWITYRGKIIYLGCSRDPQKAHDLYVKAAAKYHGEFARPG